MCSIIQVKRWRHKELKGATCSQSEQKSRVHTWDSDPKVWAYESLLPWEKNVGHAKELKKKKNPFIRQRQVSPSLPGENAGHGAEHGWGSMAVMLPSLHFSPDHSS